MTKDELLEEVYNGKRVFNNGKTRTRTVVGVEGWMIYYQTNSGRTTTGVLVDSFAKWAKGTGELKDAN